MYLMGNIGVNPKAPIFITESEYSFLVLPINITTEEIERMEKYGRKNAL